MRYALILRVLAAVCAFFSAAAFAKPALHFSGKQGQTVDIADYSYSTPPSRPLAIDFSFETGDAKRLSDLMHSNVGSQLEVKIGKQTVMMPLVRDVPKVSGLEVTVPDAETFAAVKAALNDQAK